MTTLLERIKNDQLQARKNHAGIASSLLTTLIGEAVAIGKNDGNREVLDHEIISVIRKFIKGMTETLGYLGTAEDAAAARATVLTELSILDAYLPKQLDESQLRETIKTIAAANGNNLGKVMATLKTQYTGMYDGKMASTIAKEFV